MVSRGTAAAVGLASDLMLGELPYPIHPVAVLGRTMQEVEHRLYRDARWAGAVHVAIGATLGALAGRIAGSTALTTFVTVAGNGLIRAARDVGQALNRQDVAAARLLLPALVGRDPSDLDEAGIARAVVESVAENTVDAVVAPALWGALCGAPGAAACRCINTMDSMVGHRSERYARYGWAAARLDDLTAWVPARLTAALVAAVRPHRAGETWRAVRQDAPAHPSPNAGVAEAAFAGALGLRLGGRSVYGGRVEDRPVLGSGVAPRVADIARATRLCRDVSLALVGSLYMSGRIGRTRHAP